jgi:hypothetical protein
MRSSPDGGALIASLRGHHTAWVTCSGYNPRALRFYQRAGYVATRKSIVVLSPDLTDEVIVLERSLTSGATERW